MANTTSGEFKIKTTETLTHSDLVDFFNNGQEFGVDLVIIHAQNPDILLIRAFGERDDILDLVNSYGIDPEEIDWE